jgi:hypothetical protein
LHSVVAAAGAAGGGDRGVPSQPPYPLEQANMCSRSAESCPAKQGKLFKDVCIRHLRELILLFWLRCRACRISSAAVGSVMMLGINGALQRRSAVARLYIVTSTSGFGYALMDICHANGVVSSAAVGAVRIASHCTATLPQILLTKTAAGLVVPQHDDVTVVDF